VFVPSSAVRYSPEVAANAARAFFWRKFRTKVGALYLSSFVLIPAVMFMYAHYVGVDWIIGVLGTILFFNLVIQAAYYFALPKALAKLARTLARDGVVIDATADGLKASSGQNVNSFPWDVFKHIWTYDSFVILVIGEPLANKFLHIPIDGMTADVRAAIESVAKRAVG
jgi:hypothetical protein